jgi:hypothetical protein
VTISDLAFFIGAAVLCFAFLILWNYERLFKGAMTDDEKRAYGNDLPPHLRSDPSKWEG